MKLQINDTGAWRNLMTFSVQEVESVKVLSALLMDCAATAGRVPKLQICDERGPVLTWNDVAEGWKVPRFAQGREWLP